VVAASTWGLVMLVTAWFGVLAPGGGVGPGFWLLVSGHLVVLGSGFLVLRTVGPAVGRAAGAPGDDALAGRWTGRLVVGLGVAGAAAMVVTAADPAETEWHWTMAAWLAVLAATLPLAGSLTRPARDGRWIVAGWAVGGGAVVVAYLAHHARLQSDSPSPGTAAVPVLGITLVLLLAVTVVDARRPRGAAR
jgi:hypothetical protein